MAPKIKDPLAGALPTEDSAPKPRKRTARKPNEREVPKAPPMAPVTETGDSYTERLKNDFRLFLIVIWRHLLGVDPAPIMLDMAYWLQHGPDRSIIQAFRGFSKSWITGAYALWRLFRNPQEKILVVSGSLSRAIATTNWCLQLIHEVPVLQHLKPLPHQRQSTKAFDVGPATPDQSPSFHALGIGGQIVGFRGDCIIPDDVETQTNSLTVTMREKIREAVKEFESVLKPGGVIKYLGTPHDQDSLYNKLHEKAGYAIRVWPARYPDKDLIKRYGDKLAPYVLKQLEKHGPSIVGRSTMPTRFPDHDLARREASMGRSEFMLQFMLDTTLSDADKYPLKVKDLLVMSLDPRKGPEVVVWNDNPQNRMPELPAMGFDGDFFHRGIVPDGVSFSPWTKVVAAIDPAGRGKDEAALSIVGELLGNIFWLHLWACRDGYDPKNMTTMAKAIVRYGVHKLRIESNFGDGMFTALFKPVLQREWDAENKRRANLRKSNPMQGHLYPDGGTEVEEVRSSNTMNKEKRILSVMEPVTQQHRLVVDKSVIEWDYASMADIPGEETRHYYTWGHQYTRLTRERDSLHHDDRLESLSMAISEFSDVIGVDPEDMASRASAEREEEELLARLGFDEEHNGLPSVASKSPRAASLQRQAR